MSVNLMLLCSLRNVILACTDITPSTEGFDAIVEMAEEADAISEWLPQRFRTEMRTCLAEESRYGVLRAVMIRKDFGL